MITCSGKAQYAKVKSSADWFQIPEGHEGLGELLKSLKRHQAEQRPASPKQEES